jgi:DnaJ-class molecular chaperone
MDPYAVLGLQQGASEEEAKTAFRNLAKTCHPDLHPNNAGAERRFKEINTAYEMIKNPQPEPIFQHFQFRDFPFAAGSPFEEVFGNLRGFTRQQRNNDLHMEYRLTLEDAFLGKEIELTPHPTRSIKVKIPPGVEDGTNLRIAQAGDHSNKVLSPGDLYIMIRVLPHSSLRRFGRNLLAVVPVTAFDVLLGNEIEVIGIDSKTMRIAIPSDFDTTRKMRLAGQGMQDNMGRGDLLIELFIVFPKLNDQQRVLLEQAVTLR